MSNGEFQVHNRHGDVVQRGEIDVVEVHEVETELGRLHVTDVEFRDPVELRRAGDAMVGHLHVDV